MKIFWLIFPPMQLSLTAQIRLGRVQNGAQYERTYFSILMSRLYNTNIDIIYLQTYSINPFCIVIMTMLILYLFMIH